MGPFKTCSIQDINYCLCIASNWFAETIVLLEKDDLKAEYKELIEKSEQASLWLARLQQGLKATRKLRITLRHL